MTRPETRARLTAARKWRMRSLCRDRLLLRCFLEDVLPPVADLAAHVAPPAGRLFHLHGWRVRSNLRTDAFLLALALLAAFGAVARSVGDCRWAVLSLRRLRGCRYLL